MLYKGQVCVPDDITGLHDERLVRHRDKSKICRLHRRPQEDIDEVGGQQILFQLFHNLRPPPALHESGGGEEEGEVDGIKENRVRHQLESNNLPCPHGMCADVCDAIGARWTASQPAEKRPRKGIRGDGIVYGGGWTPESGMRGLVKERVPESVSWGRQAQSIQCHLPCPIPVQGEPLLVLASAHMRSPLSQHIARKPKKTTRRDLHRVLVSMQDVVVEPEEPVECVRHPRGRRWPRCLGRAEPWQ